MGEKEKTSTQTSTLPCFKDHMSVLFNRQRVDEVLRSDVVKSHNLLKLLLVMTDDFRLDPQLELRVTFLNKEAIAYVCVSHIRCHYVLFSYHHWVCHHNL
jgi:hypothetical protein